MYGCCSFLALYLPLSVILGRPSTLRPEASALRLEEKPPQTILMVAFRIQDLLVSKDLSISDSRRIKVTIIRGGELSNSETIMSLGLV
jgi:hypothetical protein